MDGGPTCTGSGSPQAVPAGTFCIDSTEVTNAQYQAFLATSPSLSGLPPLCGWKTNYNPDVAIPSGHGAYPIVAVDWCNAWAYCKWAGKHLCGTLDGGELTPTELGTSQDEWFNACSHIDSTAYPYGNMWNPAACNGPDAAATAPVASFTKCVGGYQDLFDMVGNVDEWVNSCADGTTDGGKNDGCLRRSGSYQNPTGNLETCSFSRVGPRSFSDIDVGFRCCSELQ